MKTKEHGIDRYPANAEGWGTTIRILHELATVKDVKRLNAYCKKDKYNGYLGDDDSEVYESWSRAFQGERLYYLIHYGIRPGVFHMQNRRLWERVLGASVNGAVRAEEVVEPEIAAMAIAKPDLAAEPGMGNVRQNKPLRK